MNKISNTYFENKGQFFHRINTFSIGISILLVTIIYAVNSDKIEFYEDKMISPFNILEVANNQIGLDEKNSEIDFTPATEEKEPIKFIFLFDMTIQQERITELYKKNVTELIEKGRLGKLDFAACSSYEQLLVFHSIFRAVKFCKTRNNESSVDVILYTGNYAKLTNVFIPHDNVQNFYDDSKKQKEILSDICKANNTENTWTNLKEIFEHISKNKTNEEGRYIINVFSDFAHEKNRPSSLTNSGLNVELLEVKNAIQNLCNKKNTHQINIFRFPFNSKSNHKAINNNEIEGLINTIKRERDKIFAYDLSLKNFKNPRLLISKINFVIAPISQNHNAKNEITFFYPFSDTEGTSDYIAKAKAKFKGNDERYYFSFTQGTRSLNQDLILYHKPVGSKRGSESSIILKEDIQEISNPVQLSFNEIPNSEVRNNLFLTVLPDGENGGAFKYKVRINFKEKIPRNDSILLGVFSVLFLSGILSYLLIFLASLIKLQNFHIGLLASIHLCCVIALLLFFLSNLFMEIPEVSVLILGLITFFPNLSIWFFGARKLYYQSYQ